MNGEPATDAAPELMNRVPVRLYASFSAGPAGGNVAGVVYDRHGLDAARMQLIATDLGAPTTGFVRQLGPSSFQVRFFSPSAEMNMCGHVTVGVFSSLVDDRLIECGSDGATVIQQTAAGEIAIELEPGAGARPHVTIRQNPPTFQAPRTDVQELSSLLRLQESAILSPLRMAAGSLRHLFVQLATLDDLHRIDPDDAGLVALCRRLDIDTIGIWTRCPAGHRAVVRMRDLCHGVGNIEEAASGTTNGALACWLLETGSGAHLASNSIEIIAEQGFEMGRPSVIRTSVTCDENGLRTVRVSGSARRILEGELFA